MCPLSVAESVNRRTPDRSGSGRIGSGRIGPSGPTDRPDRTGRPFRNTIREFGSGGRRADYCEARTLGVT